MLIATTHFSSPTSTWTYFFVSVGALLVVSFIGSVAALAWTWTRGKWGRHRKTELSDHALLRNIARVVLGVEEDAFHAKEPSLRERLSSQDNAIAHLHECVEDRIGKSETSVRSFDGRLTRLESQAHVHVGGAP